MKLHILWPLLGSFILICCTPENKSKNNTKNPGKEKTKIEINPVVKNFKEGKKKITNINIQAIGETMEGSNLCPASKENILITCYGSISDFDEVVEQHYMLSLYKKINLLKNKKTIHVHSLNTANSIVSFKQIQSISAKLIKENKKCKTVGFSMISRPKDLREIKLKVCNHSNLKKLDHIILSLRLRSSAGLAKEPKQIKVKWESIVNANPRD